MINNDLAESHLTKAKEFTDNGKFNAAMAEFVKANQLHYGDAEIHAEWGLALQQAGQYPEAVDQFWETVKIQPTYPLDVEALSDALNRDIQQNNDIVRFQKTVDAGNNAVLYHLWGQVLVSISHYDEALTQFQSAMSRQPYLALDVEQLKKALEGSKSKERQIEVFQATVDELRNPFAWNTWGKTLIELKRYSSAIEAFQKGIQAKGEWAEVYYNCGNAYYHLGDYQKAVELLQQALKRESYDELAFLLLGQAFNQLEKYPEANKTYEEAMEKAPSIQYLEFWQEAIGKLPEPESAIDRYLLVLERNYPEWKYSFYIYSQSGDFLRSLGRISDSAVQYARSITFYLGDTQQIIEKLHETLVELTDPNPTLSQIQGIIEEENQTELFLTWGIVLARLNKNDQALQQLSSALKNLSSQAQTDWPWEELPPLLMALQSPLDRQSAGNEIEGILRQLNSPDLWLSWGQVLAAALPKSQAALASYRKALLLANDWPSPAFIEIFAKALEQTTSQATILQEIQTDVDSTSRAEIFYIWAEILVALGKKKMAMEQYQQAIRLRPGVASAYYRLGQLYADQGSYREACLQFQQATERQDGYADALLEWGTALLKSEQRSEALKKYLLAIKTDSNVLGKLEEVRDLLRKDWQGWNKNVIDSFQRAVDDIKTATAYTQWGSFLYKIGRYEDAVEQHKRSVALDPDLEGYANWSNWRKAMGRAGLSDKHVQEYDEAIDKYRKNADAFNEWGIVLINLRRVEWASERFQKALEKDTKNSDAHLGWIDSLIQLNDIPKAEQEARTLITSGLTQDFKIC